MAELKGTFYGVSVGSGDPELLTPDLTLDRPKAPAGYFATVLVKE